MPDADGAPFRSFRTFNQQLPPIRLRSRARPGSPALAWFPGDGMESRLARALISARAVPFKELIESFEFFEHVRRRVRSPCVVDLCCGHGLAGMLYGVFHRDVDEVLLVDRTRPDSVDATLDALSTVAPWLPAKVRFLAGDLQTAPVPSGAAVLGVHACGPATDGVIDRALDAGGPVGLLPCCHPTAAVPGPASLGHALGHALATDIHRTYRLEAAGYRTRWSAIPAAITPMNRVIAAWPPSRPPNAPDPG